MYIIWGPFSLCLVLHKHVQNSSNIIICNSWFLPSGCHVVLLIQKDLKMEEAFGNRYLSFLIPRRHFSGQPLPCPHCFFLPSSCVLSLSQQACHSEIWIHFLWLALALLRVKTSIFENFIHFSKYLGEKSFMVNFHIEQIFEVVKDI